MRCHTSAVTETCRPNNWCNHVVFVEMSWTAAFLTVVWKQCTNRKFWQTRAEHSRPVQRPLKMLDRQSDYKHTKETKNTRNARNTKNTMRFHSYCTPKLTKVQQW